MTMTLEKAAKIHSSGGKICEVADQGSQEDNLISYLLDNILNESWDWVYLPTGQQP